MLSRFRTSSQALRTPRAMRPRVRVCAYGWLCRNHSHLRRVCHESARRCTVLTLTHASGIEAGCACACRIVHNCVRTWP